GDRQNPRPHFPVRHHWHRQQSADSFHDLPSPVDHAGPNNREQHLNNHHPDGFRYFGYGDHRSPINLELVQSRIGEREQRRRGDRIRERRWRFHHRLLHSPDLQRRHLASLPIYPENVVNLFISPTGTTQTSTVYVSTTSCGTTDGCFSTVVPITAPANAVGDSVILPATPNSLAFNGQGSTAYLGTNSGLFGTVGLAMLNTSTNALSQLVSVPGKVLAVSPDGSKVIISDTSAEDGPNHVFVLDTT